MPRKKNGMKFELLPRPTKDENGQPLLYPRPAIGITYSMHTLDDFAHKYRCLPPRELTRILNCFMEVAVIHMQHGERIDTPIGSFAPKLRLDGDFSDPKKVRPKDVHLAGIEYIPSKEFVRLLEALLDEGFVQKPDLVHTKPLHVLREEGTIDEALQKCLKRSNFTIGTFCLYSGMKYSTARDYLNKLCKGDPPVLEKWKFGTSMLFYPYKGEEPKKE